VPLDLQPVLVGPTVLLRPLVEGDFDALYAIASDPVVWEQHPAKDRTQEPVFRRWFAEALASAGALVAVERTSGEVIGTSRLVQHGHDEVEIGWTFLSPARWGGIWNGEVKRLMLDHAFLEVQRVRFTVHSDNVRSQQAVRRLGAEQIGTAADHQGRGENLLFRLERESATDAS
jgi:RimJ/RimL family protein N-acetyltransferase